MFHRDWTKPSDSQAGGFAALVVLYLRTVVLMAITRATVTLAHTSGAEIDNVVNVWHFEHGAVLGPTVGAVIGANMEQFYASIFSWYSGTMRRALSTHVIELASLTMGAEGAEDDIVSRAEYLWPMPTSAPFNVAGGPNIPSEVASCLSFTGLVEGIAEESGLTRPRARRRGRVYLGPFCTVAHETSTAQTYEQRFSTFLADTILDAYETMVTALQTHAENITHVIYSPTSALGFVVKTAWMDNAFDTMRSRGQAASLRWTRELA